MRPNNMFFYQASINETEKARSHAEFSRLLTAAVVNKQFCKLLLTNPSIALAKGYCGENFNFTKEEKQRVLSITASSIEDFAQQLIQEPTRAAIPAYAGD